MKLVKFEKNYADEFEVQAFSLLSEKDLDSIFTLAKLWSDLSHEGEFEISFGTNESLTFYGFDSFQESFTIIEVSLEEETALKRLFSSSKYAPELVEFGTGLRVFDLCTYYENVADLLEEHQGLARPLSEKEELLLLEMAS